MDERKQRNIDPWDDAVYGTGNTRPPKNHGGLIAALLTVVIFLSGIVSALGMMNIKLFQELNELAAQEDEQLPISFSVSQEMEQFCSSVPLEEYTEAPTQPLANGELTLSLQPSPQSMENISQEGGLSWQEIYEKNIPSVVSITAGNVSGTGVIFSQDGYIVTNAHVIDHAGPITVLLQDQRSCTARVVGADAVSDLAVLDIDANGLTPAEFGNSDALRVGDAVAAIGDPLGLELRGTLTNGIISAINRDLILNGRTMTLLQTNAALNMGNSGGPLVNCYGQVVGINTMKISAFTERDSVEGLGFAIPSTTVKEVVDQLIRQGYVSGRATLGITGESVSRFDQYYYNIPAGLYITHLVPGSSAALQGVEEGDILVSLNGLPITSQQELYNVLHTLNPGDSVTALFYRSGNQYELTLTLAEDKG